MKKSIQFLLFFLLLSCTKVKNYKFEESQINIDQLVQIDPITLKVLDNKYLSAIEETDFGQKLLIFDYNFTKIKEIAIPENDSFGMILSYQLTHLDSLLVLYENTLLIMSNNEILNSYNLENPYSDKDGNQFVLGDYNGVMFDFCILNNYLIIPQYSYDINYWEFDFYKTARFVKIDLKNTQNKIPLNIVFPTSYQNKSYGSANRIIYTKVDDFLFYSFSANNEIIKYNLNTNKRNNFTKNSPSFFCAPFDIRNKDNMSIVFDHLIENDVVMKILSDNNDLIFQIIYSKIRLINEDNSFNTLKDKTVSINIFNKNGDFLKQIKPENNVKWHYSFIINGKLYLKNKENESFTVFSSSID